MCATKPNSARAKSCNYSSRLQRQLLEQQQEMNRLQEVPQVPVANQGDPWNLEVPPAPVAPAGHKRTSLRGMYYNRETHAAQQDEFNDIKQGSMTVLEAVKKFEKLACLCPKLVPNKIEKVRRLMKMFHTDIAKQMNAGSSPPTIVANCISRAIRAENWINQDKETR
ncbi:hypothetical protein TIFTF001_040214 [Ficus carica]|uniref:Retrotransposon gag domain-containing protein n=1 Tax=Ficus carica TaxID=3494 RepID=A0AA87YSZ5_FICCA|nr:hypothetical protein TIFTF001_040214 [Ficus carica]